MRDKFEEWAKDYVKGRDSNDRYTSPYTQAAWEAWQAAFSVMRAFPTGASPRGARYLFWSPGNPNANNGNARWSHFRIDEFSLQHPDGQYQYPEAPYTHFAPLPAEPSH